MTIFPSLHPIVDTFTARDGTSHRLVALRGTVPISYKGAPYKIPVHIWAMAYHPTGPPLMFVVPTSTMVFRQRHPHVDYTNGLVYLPYLSEWDALSSSLCGAINSMIIVFSRTPPVYSRDPAQVISQEEVERRRLSRRISERVELALTKKNAEAADTIAKLHIRKDAVIQEESARQSLSQQLYRERFDIHRAQNSLRDKLTALHKWHADHLHPLPDADIDDITHPATVLQQQSIDCGARDAALTDALDQLDEAIAKGVIDDETYMRDVRRIAREQFFTRALLRKVQQSFAAVAEPVRTEGASLSRRSPTTSKALSYPPLRHSPFSARHPPISHPPIPVRYSPSFSLPPSMLSLPPPFSAVSSSLPIAAFQKKHHGTYRPRGRR